MMQPPQSNLGEAAGKTRPNQPQIVLGGAQLAGPRMSRPSAEAQSPVLLSHDRMVAWGLAAFVLFLVSHQQALG